jgi:hypothetical protein
LGGRFRQTSTSAVKALPELGGEQCLLDVLIFAAVESDHLRLGLV